MAIDQQLASDRPIHRVLSRPHHVRMHGRVADEPTGVRLDDAQRDHGNHHLPLHLPGRRHARGRGPRPIGMGTFDSPGARPHKVIATTGPESQKLVRSHHPIAWDLAISAQA